MQHTERPGWVSDCQLRQSRRAWFRLFVCVIDDLKHQKRYSTKSITCIHFADPLIQSDRIKLSSWRLSALLKDLQWQLDSAGMWTFWSVGQSLNHRDREEISEDRTIAKTKLPDGPREWQWNCLGRVEQLDSTLIHLSSIFYIVNEKKTEALTNTDKKKTWRWIAAVQGSRKYTLFSSEYRHSKKCILWYRTEDEHIAILYT